MNPFKSIVEIQLELLYQWLTITKNWLEAYSASSASLKPVPVVVKAESNPVRAKGCVGPADLRS